MFAKKYCALKSMILFALIVQSGVLCVVSVKTVIASRSRNAFCLTKKITLPVESVTEPWLPSANVLKLMSSG